MKQLLLTAAFCLITLTGFGQDSLHIGTPQTDTLSEPLIPCYAWKCEPIVSHTYIVASSYQGAIDIGGTGMAEVLIMTEDYVHHDTCTTLFPFAGAELRLLFDFPAAARIVVNSYEGAVITVTSKIDTSVVRALPLPLVAVDTLCPLLAISETFAARKAVYYDPTTLQKVIVFQPNKAYLVRYED